MEQAISIDRSAIWATRNERIEALKTRNVSPTDNQQPVEDRNLNKLMDPELYEATNTGDAHKFMDALEAVSDSRRLALSLIFHQVTPSGNSLLHVAACSRKEDVMELILIHFPNTVTRKNSSDDTPLHVAVQAENLNATEKLIRLGIDSEIIYWKNKDSKSPLYLAVETGNMEVLRLLLGTSARDEAYAVKIQGKSPVLAALQKSNLDMMEEIINWLPKLLHVPNEDGGTPLHSAASIGNVQAVELLLSKCRYLALKRDDNGSYPIHIACEGNNADIISKLVKTWPDLAEIKNSKDQNILHVAAKGGKTKAVKHILTKHRELDIRKLVNSQDVEGNTPLLLAAMNNHCLVMLYLTGEEGTHFELLNNDKLTALDVAMECGSLSRRHSALLGRIILITAGVRRNRDGDVWSPREQSSAESKSSRADWVKDLVNTRLAVATLVATVTFAAGFTLPGGYNAFGDPHPGTATMLHNRVFQLFVISITLAMYSSIHAVVVLLWGHVTDFSVAQLAHSTAGPILLAALTWMSVAFMAAVILAVSKLTWLAILVLCISACYLVMLIMVLAPLIFPFSKSAMHIGSFYYKLVVQPRLDARGIWRYSRSARQTLGRYVPAWLMDL